MEQAERQGFDERQGSDVLRLGVLEVRPRDGLATVQGRALPLSVREFGLLVAFVRSGAGIVRARGPLPRGLGRAAARRRPLDRRLRPQAAREARGRGAGHAVDPHPRRLRLPVRPGALHTLFTPRSRLCNRLICSRCEPRRRQLQGAHPCVPRRSSPSAARRCCAAASPPAAATAAVTSGSSSSASSSGAQKGGTINGAGATFPAPGLPASGRRRFKDAQGTTVNYQAIGSGGGIAQFTAGTVDFGALRRGDEGRGDQGRRGQGRRRPRPDGRSARSRSPTTSTASTRA